MNTRKTIHKVYLAWDFKKEELWLNEMAAEGWALERFFWSALPGPTGDGGQGGTASWQMRFWL